jgi:hypothetical protein
VAKFRYLGTKIANKNLIQEKISTRLNSSNACYHSVQKLFLFVCCIKTQKTIMLTVVLYGRETWSLTLGEAHWLRVFQKRVLRRIIGPKRDEVTGGWRKLQNEEVPNLYSSPNIIRMIKSRRMRWAGHVARMGTRGMHTWYWWESQIEKDHDVGGWKILKWILER